MFFGQKKSSGTTSLILDIENGSVGATLARFSPSDQPKLFGEVRHQLPLLASRDSGALARAIEKSVHDVLLHTNTIASRLRNAPGGKSQESIRRMGDIDRAAVFLGAPWGTPDLSVGKPNYTDSMRRAVGDEVRSLMPDARVSFHTAADSAAFGMQAFRPDETLLVCTVRGEIVEILLLGPEGVAGYATLPVGHRTVVRTLKTHGGLSDAEAHSLLTLSPHIESDHESLQSASRHFVEQFSGAAQDLLVNGAADGVFVIAEHPMGEWFARTLGQDDSLAALFPHGAVVRALGTQHFSQLIAAHAPTPDLFLMLEALFVDRKLSGIY